MTMAPDDFEALLRPCMDRVYRLAYRLTGNQADSEDLVQDLLIKLYPRRDELSSIENLTPWLGRILYNLFIDQIRRKPRLSLVDVDANEMEISQTRSTPATDELDISRLEKALAQLSEEHRVVVLMHDAEGYKLEEIHRITGVPVGTVKSRLHQSSCSDPRNSRLARSFFVPNGTFSTLFAC